MQIVGVRFNTRTLAHSLDRFIQETRKRLSLSHLEVDEEPDVSMMNSIDHSDRWGKGMAPECQR